MQTTELDPASPTSTTDEPTAEDTGTPTTTTTTPNPYVTTTTQNGGAV